MVMVILGILTICVPKMTNVLDGQTEMQNSRSESDMGWV